MKTVFFTAVIVACSYSSAIAATFEWRHDTVGISVGSNSLSQTVDGVTVTATGYVAELGLQSDYPGGYTDANVIGPFPTQSSDGASTQFGIDTRGIGEQLGLYVDLNPGIDVSGSDFSSGGIGFDSGPFPNLGEFGNRFHKFDFAVFEFDQAVDVGSVLVDDVSNLSRSAWLAFGTEIPDFSGGFLSGISDLNVINSQEDAADGIFEHVLNATDITVLVVGAQPKFDLGPLDAGGSHFLIDSFGVELASGGGNGGGGNAGGGNQGGGSGSGGGSGGNGGGSGGSGNGGGNAGGGVGAEVPLPAAGWLLISALGGLTVLRNRKSA